MHQICCQMWDTWRMIMVITLFVQGRCHAYQTMSVSHFMRYHQTCTISWQRVAASLGTLLSSRPPAKALGAHLMGWGLIYRVCCDLSPVPFCVLILWRLYLYIIRCCIALNHTSYKTLDILLSELDLYIHRYCIVWSLPLPNAHSSFGRTGHRRFSYLNDMFHRLRFIISIPRTKI